MFPQLFHRFSKGNSEVSHTEMELLLARFDRLESEIKGIRTEWNDTYDKVSHLYDRTRKRIAALKKAEDAPESTNGALVEQERLVPQTRTEILNLARARRMF